MINEKIKNLIEQALDSLELSERSEISIEHPDNSENGDYSANVALVYARGLRTQPRILAERIVEKINKNLPQEISKVEVAGAGFINFYLSREFFGHSVKTIVKEENVFGLNNSLKNQKTIVEYTDPNPFKEFHIGHLMSNTIGESISRIVEWNGAETKRACYQGDVGLHVAKAIWGLMKGEDIKNAYVVGNSAYEGEAKKEIEEINKKIYERSDEKINHVYDTGREESLLYFDSVYKKLGTHFDYFFFESEVADFGKEIVEKNIGNIFEKGDEGAIIFRAENLDKHLHTRVFVNKEGLPTYEAKELGLAKIKHDRYPYDKSIVITGNEINDYFKVLLAAMSQIFPDLAQKTKHLSHGMLRLPTGKMSSRTGDVITAESLIKEVREKAQGSESAAIAAIKYMILRSSIGGDIIFDVEKSVSTEGDSGVYLQYSHARANSILEKAKSENIKENNERPEDFAVTELERMLYRFPEVVLHSMQDFAPRHITTYLTEIARMFNSFYGNTIIVKKDDPASPYKVALTHAFQIVMKNGLYLLGIEAPEKM